MIMKFSLIVFYFIARLSASAYFVTLCFFTLKGVKIIKCARLRVVENVQVTRDVSLCKPFKVLKYDSDRTWNYCGEWFASIIFNKSAFYGMSVMIYLLRVVVISSEEFLIIRRGVNDSYMTRLRNRYWLHENEVIIQTNSFLAGTETMFVYKHGQEPWTTMFLDQSYCDSRDNAKNLLKKKNKSKHTNNFRMILAMLDQTLDDINMLIFSSILIIRPTVSFSLGQINSRAWYYD